MSFGIPIRNGLGVGLLASTSLATRRGGVSFSPASLFAASEPGGWYDPSDLATLFQDSAGATPVTAAGQSVGLWLDKSGRGNHLSQSSSGQRAIYGVEPVGGRQNLLTYTEQLDNAAWTKVNSTITANAIAAPDGTTTAEKLVETAVSGQHNTLQTVATQANSPNVLSTFVFAGERDKIWLQASNPGFTSGFRALVDVTAQTATFAAFGTGVSAGAGATIAAVAAAPGWFRVTVAGIIDAVSTSLVFGVFMRNASGNDSYLGVAGSGLFLWGAMVNPGSAAAPYQRVVTAFDVTQAGVPSLSYIQFDGSDDGYVSPTITPGINKAQVFAGVRKLSDAARGVVVELGAGGAAGSVDIEAPSSASGADFVFRSLGTSSANAQAGSRAAPITAVITGLGEISTDTCIIRANGAQIASSATDQGTGNYNAGILYVGRRGGTSLPFNGRIYSLIVRFGANLPLATIQQTETWVNSKTGAY